MSPAERKAARPSRDWQGRAPSLAAWARPGPSGAEAAAWRDRGAGPPSRRRRRIGTPAGPRRAGIAREPAPTPGRVRKGAFPTSRALSQRRAARLAVSLLGVAPAMGAAPAPLPCAIARKSQPCRPPPGGTGPPPLRRRSSGSATRPRVRPKAYGPPRSGGEKDPRRHIRATGTKGGISAVCLWAQRHLLAAD